MQHLFLDTNIIIDALSDRQPFSESAKNLFFTSYEKRIHLYVSSLSFTDVFYILRKLKDEKKLVKELQKFSTLVTILNVDEAIIHQALHADLSDFEDAIQYYTAISNKKIEAIVTRNQKDFKKSKIAVMTAEQALHNI